MAQEEIYQPRIMPQAGAAPALANPETYGAGLGQSLAQAGEVVHESRIREHRLKRQLTADREAADFSHRFALHRQAMDDAVREMRTNPSSPDYADHEARVRAVDEAGRQALLDGITEDSVRRQAEQQLDAYATQLHTSEGNYAEGQRIAKTVLDRKAANDVSQNRIRQGMDPDAYATELKLNHEQIYGLGGLTPVQKDQLWKDYENGAGVAFLNHVIDTNPKAAVGLVDSGAFNSVLTPEQIEAVRNGAQVEVRRVDAQAAHAAAVAKATLTDQTDTLEEQARQGIDVSADVPALIGQWQAIGDQSRVEKLKGLARDSAFAKVWNRQTPIAREARLRELNSIPAEKRTQDQQAEIKWLEDKRGALDRQFADDRVGSVVSNGLPNEQPPALDPSNPGSYVARAQWARRLAPVYGSMDLLSKGERSAMAERLRTGDAGYSEVVDQLALFGGAAARQAAREVAPDDRYLQQLVLLPVDYRKIARDGRAALQANSKLIPNENGDDADRDVVRTSAGFEQALQALPQAERNGIKDVARHIAAKFLHDKGGTLDQRLWWTSLSMALGGTRGQGGLGHWGDATYLVPDGMTADQFSSRVMGFVRAHPDQGPKNPDGTPADLRQARPVAIGGGRYQFMVGDRAVLGRGRDGKITSAWQFVVDGGRK